MREHLCRSQIERLGMQQPFSDSIASNIEKEDVVRTFKVIIIGKAIFHFIHHILRETCAY